MSAERQGMSTTAKVLLIVGGGIGTLVLAVIVLGFFAFRTFMENAPELLEEFGEQLESVAVAGLGDVSTSFAEVVSEAGSFMLLTDGMVVEEAGEGSGFTFNLETFEGETIGFDLVSVSEYLDRVGRGELYFADVGREEADAAAVESAAPDWLSIYPGARHSASVVTEFDEFSLGIEVLLADASAAEILDWYKVSADDEDGWSLRASSSISLDAASADAPGHGSVMLAAGDRRMTVLVAEDDRRDSFFVILYKG